MEELTKEQVMQLNIEELVGFINLWLSKGVSVSKLAEQVGFRKGTILDRLKRAKYFYNGEYNAYMKPLTSEAPVPAFIAEGEAVKAPTEPKKSSPGKITLEELLERVEALEMAVKVSQKNEEVQATTFKPMSFESKTQQRNYPLHQEVINLLAEVSKDNPQFKVQDIVNHCLYVGLSQALHRNTKKD